LVTYREEPVVARALRQDAGGAQILKQIATLKTTEPKSPLLAVRVISQRAKDPRQTHLLTRGDFLQPGDAVTPGVLGVLHPMKVRTAGAPPDRLDLARWIVDPANPLTRRVIVNDIWQHLFGHGLVRTMNDFGVRGERPSHPELLDYLADEFLKVGWSRKKIIKEMVMSAAYRQTSAFRPELADRDPENRLLHRQNRYRVEGEIVRDLALSASGLLSKKIGGPSVFPPMPAAVAAISYANNFKYTASTGEDRYRRGMYTFFKRTAPHPNLMTFDCPDANATCVERNVSNTPLQALVLLNNECFVEASQGLARRMMSERLEDDAARMAMGFRLCVLRPPTALEINDFVRLLQQARTYYRGHLEDAKKLAGGKVNEGIPVDELAAWTASARAILNMDEFLTRE
jgi:hypothetical protein